MSINRAKSRHLVTTIRLTTTLKRADNEEYTSCHNFFMGRSFTYHPFDIGLLERISIADREIYGNKSPLPYLAPMLLR